MVVRRKAAAVHCVEPLLVGTMASLSLPLRSSEPLSFFSHVAQPSLIHIFLVFLLRWLCRSLRRFTALAHVCGSFRRPGGLQASASRRAYRRPLQSFASVAWVSAATASSPGPGNCFILCTAHTALRWRRRRRRRGPPTATVPAGLGAHRDARVVNLACYFRHPTAGGGGGGGTAPTRRV